MSPREKYSCLPYGINFCKTVVSYLSQKREFVSQWVFAFSHSKSWYVYIYIQEMPEDGTKRKKNVGELSTISFGFKFWLVQNSGTKFLSQSVSMIVQKPLASFFSFLFPFSFLAKLNPAKMLLDSSRLLSRIHFWMRDNNRTPTDVCGEAN